MIQLNKIYFDGKGYIQRCIDSNDPPENDIIKVCSRFNFTPVDSISFENYQPGTFCDIRIDNYYIEAVSVRHIYTNIEKPSGSYLYPSHNPTPDPGGLY